MSSPQYTDMKPAAPGGNIYQPYSQNAAIVTQPTTVVVVPSEPRPSNTGSIIFSCCVFWCCCWPLGLAAFICAIQAGSLPDVNAAREKLSLSNKLSIAGLVCGIIIIILSIILEVVMAVSMAKHHQPSSVQTVTIGY